MNKFSRSTVNRPQESTYKFVTMILFLFALSTLLTACGSDGGSRLGTDVGSGSTGNYATSVTLSWDASPSENIAGYKVYYNEGEATFPEGVFGANEGTSPITVGDSTTTTITGLNDSELHYFTVTTYDNAGNESTFSNVASTYPAVQ